MVLVFDDGESESEVAGACVGFLAEAVGDAAVLGWAAPAASAENAGGVHRHLSFGELVRVIPVGAPFEDVAAHVVDAEFVGKF